MNTYDFRQFSMATVKLKKNRLSINPNTEQAAEVSFRSVNHRLIELVGRKFWSGLISTWWTLHGPTAGLYP